MHQTHDMEYLVLSTFVIIFNIDIESVVLNQRVKCNTEIKRDRFDYYEHNTFEG